MFWLYRKNWRRELVSRVNTSEMKKELAFDVKNYGFKLVFDPLFIVLVGYSIHSLPFFQDVSSFMPTKMCGPLEKPGQSRAENYLDMAIIVWKSLFYREQVKRLCILFHVSAAIYRLFHPQKRILDTAYL